MSHIRMDPGFSDALRAELVDRVERSTNRRRARRWLWSGTGAFVGACALGTAGAFGSGLIPPPGGHAVNELTVPITQTHTGTATVDLGKAPDGATDISLELRCLTAGTFTFPDGASMRCSSTDAGTRTGLTTDNLRRAHDQHSVTITTAGDGTWSLTARYASERTTGWQTNAAGQIYGVQNENGNPDLIAATATNGRDGYVRRVDLDAADGSTAARHFTGPADALRWQRQRQGTSVSIPVYRQDGTTVIGEFIVGPG